MIGFRTTIAALGMMVAAATAQAQTVYKVGSTPTGTPFTFLDRAPRADVARRLH